MPKQQSTAHNSKHDTWTLVEYDKSHQNIAGTQGNYEKNKECRRKCQSNKVLRTTAKMIHELRARRMIRLPPERYDLNRPLVQKETYPTPHFVGSGQQGFEKKKTCIWNGKDASSQKDQQMFSWKTRCQLCCAKLLHWLMTSHCSATPVWNSGWTNFIKFLGLASSWTKEEKYPGLYKLCWNYAVTLSVNQFGTQPKVGNCLKKTSWSVPQNH